MAAQPAPAHPVTMEAHFAATPIAVDSPIPQPILTLRRLLIRPMRPQDSHSMAINADNPRIAKYMSLTFPSPYTVPAAETWISMNLGKSRQDHFVICEKSSPTVVIGGIGLKPGADVEAHTAEIGFWVGESYWGRGYTTEALEGFTKWVFLEREVQGPQTTRLWGGVFSGNGASMRCFEKCGYVREGILKGHCEKHREVFDLHIFAMTKAGWQERWSSIFNNY